MHADVNDFFSWRLMSWGAGLWLLLALIYWLGWIKHGHCRLCHRAHWRYFGGRWDWMVCLRCCRKWKPSRRPPRLMPTGNTLQVGLYVDD